MCCFRSPACFGQSTFARCASYGGHPSRVFGSLARHPKLAEGERRMERETGFEPATSTLARSHSTTELFPLATKPKRNIRDFHRSRRLSSRLRVREGQGEARRDRNRPDTI